MRLEEISYEIRQVMFRELIMKKVQITCNTNKFCEKDVFR